MTRYYSTRIIIGLGILLSFFTASAQNNKPAGKFHKIEALPKEMEIRLALSALPPHLRDSATVYVLNVDKGFETARKGTNGFHCFVSRNGDDAMRGAWSMKDYRDDILYPIAFDAAGAKNIMPVFFDIARMQAEGMAPDAVKKTIQERFKKKFYKAPERAGISYMLSPILRTYTNPDADDNVVTASVPHVMYYAPNVTNDEVGGSKPAPGAKYPFLILHGPHGYNIQFLGQVEAESVRNEYKDLLEQLCKINAAWCLPAATAQAPASHHH
jgi:hypothetical protein